jgi:predicted DNA-binding transcriptional regulator YafY
MNRFDRALGILLLLRSGKTLSANELARRFEVAPRTIYRDIEALCAVGVPIYAEPGRNGGFRLIEGYFLPPVTFSVGEATSLLTGLALLRRLRARPFPVDLHSAGDKLLAALPEPLRGTLANTEQIIGIESLPHDSFHPDLTDLGDEPDAEAIRHESQIITGFLRAIFEQRTVIISYKAPDRPQRTHHLVPQGLIWDRNRWYLIGLRHSDDPQVRMLRADRALDIQLADAFDGPRPPFNIEQMLGRRWLSEAMEYWISIARVQIRITAAQAERLQRDWYYGHASFEPQADGSILMQYGEHDRHLVFELLRWLGPGAELISPAEWRADFVAELRAQIATYGEKP